MRDGLNWYTYCGNNPVAFIDPWGLSKYSTQNTATTDGPNSKIDPYQQMADIIDKVMELRKKLETATSKSKIRSIEKQLRILTGDLQGVLTGMGKRYSADLVLHLADYERDNYGNFILNSLAIGNGLYSIGFGHTITGDEPFALNENSRITLSQACQLMIIDLDIKTSEIESYEGQLSCTLNQWSFDAALSFAYNIRDVIDPGQPFKRVKTLVQLMGAGNKEAVTSYLMSYTGAGGKYLGGLFERRTDECRIYLYGDYSRYESRPHDAQSYLRR